MRQHRRELAASVLLMTGLAAAVHLIAYYLPNYATFQLHIPRDQAVWAGFTAAAMMVVFGPVAGRMTDRVGRRKMVWWTRFALLVMAYPAFVLLNAFPSLPCLLLVVGCLAIPMAMTSPADAGARERGAAAAPAGHRHGRDVLRGGGGIRWLRPALFDGADPRHRQPQCTGLLSHRMRPGVAAWFGGRARDARPEIAIDPGTGNSRRRG